MLYDADRILDMDFLRDLYKNFAVITLAVSVSLWPRPCEKSSIYSQIGIDLENHSFLCATE